MHGSLIIDARHRLRWWQRLASDASTALLWSGWLWLWAPLLRALAAVDAFGARVGPVVPKLLALHPDTALCHAAALVGASGTLVVWNRVVAPRSAAAPPLALRDHARHLHLPEHELRAGRDAAICVVHHDEQGRIVRVERREPVARPATRAEQRAA